jgi:hypothetical protein
MTYKLSTKGNKIEVSLKKTELVTEVEKTEYAVSLARAGGQGSKGDSITNAYINANEELIVEITNSAGTVTTINAGNVTANLGLNDLVNVTISMIEDGDYIAYDFATSTYKNHKLTTSRLTDVDNTNKANGALLVYSSSSGKYIATNQLNNPDTVIVGGTF